MYQSIIIVMNSILKYIKLIITLTAILNITSCKKLVDVSPPPSQIADKNVFNNNETAISVLTGIYVSMSNDGNFTGLSSMTMYTALAADELTLDKSLGDSRHLGYYSNSLGADANVGSQLWTPIYNYIYKCNAALEGL